MTDTNSPNWWDMENNNHRNWWDDFLKRSNQTEQIRTQVVSNAELFGLDKAQSMVSVGPAAGDLDRDIIRACMGQLKHYIGVEPSPDLFNSLTTTIGELQGIKVTLAQDSVPEWSGPPEPVDIVLVSHVLYYPKEPMVAVKQFYSWLKPGGSVILLHAYKDDMFNQTARELNINALKRYGNAAMKEDLRREGFTFQEMDYKVRVHSPDHDGIAKLYVEAWVGPIPKEEMNRVLAAFREKCQGKTIDAGRTEGWIKIDKPQK